jgi:signal transduction histidine kinase
MFELFADLIALSPRRARAIAVSETALLERHTAQLREQFIAVLGHDLRNPLNAITGGTEILLRMSLDQKATPVVAMVQRTSVRMAGFIDNVLDFARGRLGGGLALVRTLDAGVDAVLEQVIAEARTAWPDRDIRSEFTLRQAVACDADRIAQILELACERSDPR